MPAKFKMPDGKEVGESIPLMKYFRKQDESLEDFNKQLKQLSEADKTELAIGAAKELGYEQIS